MPLRLIRYDGIYLRTRDGKETHGELIDDYYYCHIQDLSQEELFPTNPATIFIYYYETNEVENTV